MREPIHAINSAGLFTPLSYRFYRVADRKKGGMQGFHVFLGITIRPIDRILQTVACLILAVGEHFHDLYLTRKRGDDAVFAWKFFFTPITLPCKVGIKTSVFMLVGGHDLLFQDLPALFTLGRRIQQSRRTLEKYWLLRDCEEREVRLHGENVLSLAHYESRELRKLSSLDRVERLHVLQTRRKKRQLYKIYRIVEERV